MASRKKILFPRSDIPGRAPTLNEIDFGEIAINTHDGKAYIKKDKNGEVSINSIGAEDVDNVYYVSKSGVPGNDGKSLMNAFSSLDSAVAVVYAKENFKFDETTCERDLNLIMDGVRYDMALGTNYGAVTAGQSYKRGNAIKVTAEQLYQTRRAINEERLGMVSVPAVKTDATSKLRVASGFDEIIEILVGGTASALEFPDPPVEAQTDANAASNAIQTNKEAIQDAVLDYLNNPANDFLTGSYDATTCSRDVGLIVNAVARDLLLGTDYNTITAGWAYNRSSSAYVLSDQNEATIAGINFARDYIIALAGVTSDTDIENLFKNVTDVINATQTVYPTINYVTTAGATYQTADRIAATTNLQANRATLISDTTVYINANYPGLGYDQAKCERDVGYIIDGLSHDVKYGGNTATRTNALAYFSGTVSQLGFGEGTATVAAYNDLKTRINAVVTTAPEQTVLGGLVDEITGVITAGNTTGLSAEVNIVTTGLITTEYDAIVAGIVGAQAATIDYVDLNWSTKLGGYNAGKCARDVGLILDAVARDLLLGSDFWTIAAGNSYLRANTAYVLSDQKQATIDAVNFAKSKVKALVGALDATVDTLFERVIDVLDGTVTTVQTYATYPANGTYASSQFRDIDHGTIRSQRSALITATTNFITANYSGLAYDQAKCERDTGFVIDAINIDLLYGGNTASRNAALSYFAGTNSQLGSGETAPTVAAYNFLAGEIKNYTSENARVDELMGLVTGVITAGNTDSIPAEVEVDTAGLTTTDFDAIVANRLIIQNDVIDYVNDQNIVGSFDQHKCERDTGLIIDAIALDLQNNTDYNSITAGLAYQRGNAQKVQSDQLQYTIDSINYLRDQINASGINATSQTFVTARIKQITELLEESTAYGKEDGTSIDFTGTGSESADKRNAANALIVNRRTIQGQLITWIQNNFDSLEYDQDKCQRDVGYIVDAVTHDILFDGSFATDTNARSYWVGKDLNIENTTTAYESLDGLADIWTNQLGAGEITASLAAYEQLKTIINNYVTTSTEEARVVALIERIRDAINAADGSAIPVVVPTFTGESSTFHAIRSTLQEQVVFYANSVFPTYSYDQATCRRDVGYILDALTYDLKYGGNSATSIAMRAYFSIFGNGYADRLGQSELTATIAAYEQLKSIIAGYTAGTDSGNITKIQNLLDIIIHAVEQSSIGTFQLGDFFNGTAIYQYNYPTGLAVGYDSLVFPDLVSIGISTTTPEIYTAWTKFEQGITLSSVPTPERQTIIRQSSETAQNQGTDTTIFLKSGDYTVNNPIKLPPKTSIIGDALRATTIRPRNVDSDIFWVDNGCYVKEVTFRDHQNGAACVAFDPRNDAITGPFITQSPYVQNCTSLTTSGIGMKIDGSKVSGLRSMVLDAFTQFNADGIGVHLTNRAYAQLVSCFTISTSTSILAETGGQCSVTNSNSSFGDRGLVSTGGSESIYNGSLHADYNLNDDIIRINGITNTDAANYSLQLGDFKKPNYNDAIKFDSDNYYYTVLDVSDEILQNWGVSGNTDQIVYETGDTPRGNYHSAGIAMSSDDTTLTWANRDASYQEFWERAEGSKTWQFVQSIAPVNPINNGTGSSFGYAPEQSGISADGKVVVTGAENARYVTGYSDTTTLHGAAYVFEKDGSTWSQTHFLEDSVSSSPTKNGQTRQFGKRTSISGDGNTICISNKFDSDTNFISGAIHVFNRDSALDPDGFTFAQKLLFPKGTASFAPSTAISNDGGSILAAWRGDVAYYYTKNQFGTYSISQNISLPQFQNNGTISDHIVAMNPDATYAAFANPTSGNTVVSRAQASSVGVSNILVDSAEKFTIGQTLYSGSFENANYEDRDANLTDGTTVINIPASNQLTISSPNIGTWDGSNYVFGYTDETGGVDMFAFKEGNWTHQETLYPSDGREGTRMGRSIDINDKGDIVVVGANRSSASEVANDTVGAYIFERGGTNWTEVNILRPQNRQFNGDTNASFNDDRFGEGVAVGGSADYLAISAPERTADVSIPYRGAAFTYSSILPETGSYDITIAPPLNKNMKGEQTSNFHQRSLISASSHTFEFVGSGTNMFAAVPQNGGIPKKDLEVVFDSADAAQPNFGLVYFTATDELGDFRIGGDLTINRESGTITGTTFDRSLFAVLTPYILALEG